MRKSKDTVLITGVAGFLGRHIARYFTEQGWTVIGTDRPSSENARLAGVNRYYVLQLPDRKLYELVEKESPALCVHCAGQASVPLSVSDPASDFHAGPVLTFEVLNALRLHAPECRFILLSSAAVYGNPRSLPVSETQPTNPISPYGFHKLQCEQLCREFFTVYGLRAASLRIFSAYGTGLRRQVLWDICRKVLEQGALKLQGTGAESRDFVHARDIAAAIGIVSSRAPLQGEVYNLGSGQEISIRELAGMALTALGSQITPQFDGVVPAGTPLNWRAGISKLTSLGYAATKPLSQGIKEVADWCHEELKRT